MPALARDGRWLAGGRRPRRAAGTAAWPCAAVGQSVIINGGGAPRQHPPRRRGVMLSAGQANQPAQSVHAPARAHRPSPVVRLPERGRVREGRTAPRHVTTDDRSPDLVPDDAVSGDRNRMGQRIKAHRRPRGQMVAARLLAGGAELCSRAGPAGSARPSGVSGGSAHELTGFRVTRRHSALHSREERSLGSGSRPGYPGTGPRIPSSGNARAPRCVTGQTAGAAGPAPR
jgi:hypothetical protein